MLIINHRLITSNSLPFSKLFLKLILKSHDRVPATKIVDKVFIPQEDHPDINFVGLLIGPRGNTLKELEKEVSRFNKTSFFNKHIFSFFHLINAITNFDLFLIILMQVSFSLPSF